MAIKYWYSQKQKNRMRDISVYDPCARHDNYVKLPNGSEVMYTECCDTTTHPNYVPMDDDTQYLGETPDYSAIRIKRLKGYESPHFEYDTER